MVYYNYLPRWKGRYTNFPSWKSFACYLRSAIMYGGFLVWRFPNDCMFKTCERMQFALIEYWVQHLPDLTDGLISPTRSRIWYPQGFGKKGRQLTESLHSDILWQETRQRRRQGSRLERRFRQLIHKTYYIWSIYVYHDIYIYIHIK